MLELIVAYFSKPEMSIMGILVLLCFFVIGALVRRLDKKDQEIKALNEGISALQEKRVTEYSKVIENDTKFKSDLVASTQAVQKSIDGVARVLELRKSG